MESYERLEQQFNEMVAKQAAPVAVVTEGGHGPLHGVVRWLRNPMPPGTVLCQAPAGDEATQPPRWCDFVKSERDKVLATSGVQDRFGDADLAPGKHGGTVALMPSGVAPCGGCHKPPELTCAHFKAASGVKGPEHG